MKMKSNSKFIMLGVIALTGVTAFTSCSSDESVPVNPTFDGQSVKTAFALNIPHAAKGTRMSEETVQGQATPVFRGMDEIFLFPLSVAPAAGEETVFPFSIISLGDLGTSEISTTKSSKIYADVNVSVGTTNFLFYGTAATKTATDAANTAKFSNGYVTSTLATTNASTKDIEFSLNPVHSTVTDALTTPEAYLAGVLNYIMAASDGAATPTTWASLKASTEPRYQLLKDTYNALAKATDIRGGSANAVLFTVNALYNNIDYALSIAANNTENTTLRAIYSDIKTRIEAYFTATATGLTGTDPQGYRVDKYSLAYQTGSMTVGSTNYTVDAKITNFPVEQSLPEGAAQLTWNDTDSKFEYLNTPKVVNGTTNAIDVTKICYPVELMYYCNTPAKASNKSYNITTEWPQTTSNWDAETFWTSDWKDIVSSTTRSIALRDNINYGVALLKVTVKASGTENTKTTKYELEDNAAAKGDAAENRWIPIKDAGFPLSGVFVGGQPSVVGWNFLSAATAQKYNRNADRTYVVYDCDMNGTPAATQGTATGANYTLVFDNYKQGETEANQDPVNVALEFTNNTEQDFYGFDGLICKGQKFYLIGQLNPNATSGVSGSITWPTDPTGATSKYAERFPANNVKRVFIQDYTTTANFTINDLKKAYVTIPDLRVASLELGLSVDLTWNSGLTYDVPLGN